MNLYESISSKINEKKDFITIINDCEEEYQARKKLTEEVYSKIVEVCPIINEENNSDVLDFLEYLYEYGYMENNGALETVETVLTAKGYKENTENFSDLVSLVLSLILE